MMVAAFILAVFVLAFGNREAERRTLLRALRRRQ
jgi:hypothetical protein